MSEPNRTKDAASKTKNDIRSAIRTPARLYSLDVADSLNRLLRHSEAELRARGVLQRPEPLRIQLTRYAYAPDQEFARKLGDAPTAYDNNYTNDYWGNSWANSWSDCNRGPGRAREHNTKQEKAELLGDFVKTRSDGLVLDRRTRAVFHADEETIRTLSALVTTTIAEVRSTHPEVLEALGF